MSDDTRKRFVVVANVNIIGIVGPHRGIVGIESEYHQTLRIVHRKRAQKDRVDEREDGGVRSNAESQGHDRHRGEPSVLQQQADRMARVLADRLE